MSKTRMSIGVLIGTFFVAGAMLAGVSGCRSAKKQEANPAAAGKPEEKHEAHHGGCLNAIETCAVGHAEVKLEGDVLKVWFVGGENETDKAVRVSDKQIALSVRPNGGEEKSLTLDARPIDLAGEKVGDCSYFEGRADWLAGLKKFDATGKVNLKGKERPIKIEYPDGYDPDDQAEKAGEPKK
jgi:hypothetical protein